MRSRKSSRYARLIPALWEPVRLYQRFLAKKQMNSEEEAATAENTVPPQDVPDVWAGLTQLHPNMDAGCREPQMWPLQYWMYWAIWMKSRYVWAMRLMEK